MSELAEKKSFVTNEEIAFPAFLLRRDAPVHGSHIKKAVLKEESVIISNDIEKKSPLFPMVEMPSSEEVSDSAGGLPQSNHNIEGNNNLSDVFSVSEEDHLDMKDVYPIDALDVAYHKNEKQDTRLVEESITLFGPQFGEDNLRSLSSSAIIAMAKGLFEIPNCPNNVLARQFADQHPTFFDDVSRRLGLVNQAKDAIPAWGYYYVENIDKIDNFLVHLGMRPVGEKGEVETALNLSKVHISRAKSHISNLKLLTSSLENCLLLNGRPLTLMHIKSIVDASPALVQALNAGLSFTSFLPVRLDDVILKNLEAKRIKLREVEKRAAKDLGFDPVDVKTDLFSGVIRALRNNDQKALKNAFRLINVPIDALSIDAASHAVKDLVVFRNEFEVSCIDMGLDPNDWRIRSFIASAYAFRKALSFHNANWDQVKDDFWLKPDLAVRHAEILANTIKDIVQHYKISKEVLNDKKSNDSIELHILKIESYISSMSDLETILKKLHDNGFDHFPNKEDRQYYHKLISVYHTSLAKMKEEGIDTDIHPQVYKDVGNWLSQLRALPITELMVNHMMANLEKPFPTRARLIAFLGNDVPVVMQAEKGNHVKSAKDNLNQHQRYISSIAKGFLSSFKMPLDEDLIVNLAKEIDENIDDNHLMIFATDMIDTVPDYKTLMAFFAFKAAWNKADCHYIRVIRTYYPNFWSKSVSKLHPNIALKKQKKEIVFENCKGKQDCPTLSNLDILKIVEANRHIHPQSYIENSLSTWQGLGYEPHLKSYMEFATFIKETSVSGKKISARKDGSVSDVEQVLKTKIDDSAYAIDFSKTRGPEKTLSEKILEKA